MRKLGVVLVAAAVVGALGVQTASSAPQPMINLTECGVVVPLKTIAVLQNDIVCTANPAVDPHFGLVMKKNAELDLNGHTITMVQDGATTAPVLCENACEIRNGVLTNDAPDGGLGILALGVTKLTVSDVTISRVATGVDADGTVIATNLSVQSSLTGILTKKVEADHLDVTLRGTGDAHCIDASANGGNVTGDNISVTGCDVGVYGLTRVKITGLQASSSNIGVFSEGPISVTDSNVTGNATYDIMGKKRPLLDNTVCGTSARVQNDVVIGTWGLCAND